MNSDPKAAVVRVRQYAYVDGLVEIATGVLFCAVALLFTIEALAEPESRLSGLSAIGLPVVVLLGVWLSGKAVAAAKERIVYPRTGKVEYRRAPRGRRLLVGAAAAVVALGVVAAVAALGQAALPWLPFLTAAIVGLFLTYIGYELQVVRFYLLGGVSAVLGAVASLGSPNETIGSAAYFWAMGGFLIVAGGVVLWRYLRHYSRPTDQHARAERAG